MLLVFKFSFKLTLDTIVTDKYQWNTKGTNFELIDSKIEWKNLWTPESEWYNISYN